MKSETETEIEKPLITVALVAYRQKRFIEEAVRGALAQTYEPLEIILSDDDSPDGTFAIMEHIASEYNGPHSVILNRNGSNLGLGRHLNKVMSMAHGEWIVAMAGDDVSFPYRIERLYEKVLAHPKAKGVSSAWNVIDENGIPRADRSPYQGRKGEVVISKIDLHADPFAIRGASVMWHRSLFDFFGPMMDGVNYEDYVYTFRALLLGEMVAFPDVLLSWRHWNTKVALQDYLSKEEARHYTINEHADLISFNQHVYIARQLERDLLRCLESGLLNHKHFDEIASQIIWKEFVASAGCIWWDVSVWHRLWLLFKGGSCGYWSWALGWAVPRLAGLKVHRIYRSFRIWFGRVRRKIFNIHEK